MQRHFPFAYSLLTQRIKRFLADSSGAITVDWVVLTAAIMAMVAAFMGGFTPMIRDFVIMFMASP